jgi:CRISPR/Cas system-associated exonuclease Cas4 (RecB family)
MRFLEEIAQIVIDKYQGRSEDLMLVFPNRRAGLFFRKYLAARIDKPIWAPRVVGIEDFIKGMSDLKSADSLELIYRLFKVFTSINQSAESFDRFFYWGNILLKDFDEVDKFMVDAGLLFKNLQHIKQLERNLDFLTADQKELIMGFWKSFGEKLSTQQKDFLGIWDNLYETYEQFRHTLAADRLAYDGMIYRAVAEGLDSGHLKTSNNKVVFAGFNALSTAEELVISWFVKEERGEVYWDADDYYLNSSKQESGLYLREMKYGNAILRNTFKKSYGNNFLDSKKKVEVISVASEVGQAQEASRILRALEGRIDENTSLVLPNNALLFPVLHALPPEVGRLNITMGYALNASTLFTLLDAVISMHIISEGKKQFHFRNVLAVLKHPLIARLQDEVVLKITDDIADKNMLWIPESMLVGYHQLLSLLFSSPSQSIAGHLRTLLQCISDQQDDDVEKEFAFRFHQLFQRIDDFMSTHSLLLPLEAFQKIFRQLSQNERLPFEGEPLLGLQIMGILETRNLDFQNVIVLSMNEGSVPPPPQNVSFIPHSIRKVFGLPVTDHHDAMHAYILYRLLQRAQNVYFIYNSTEETGRSGEVSRFVRQLETESNLAITFRSVSGDLMVEDPNVITITKTEEILDILMKYTAEAGFHGRLTPTAINTYIECRLRFYFRYVLGLREIEEVAEEVESRVFGNIFHQVMERLYQPYDMDGNRRVSDTQLREVRSRVDKEINRGFVEQFGSKDETFVFEGQHVLASGIIKKMVLKVLDFDQQQVPFEILGVEANEKKGYLYDISISAGGSITKVGIKGIIDRIESKSGHVAIVDYKTGRDDRSFSDIQSLFDRQATNRNKAALQTFIYALLYMNSGNCRPDLPIQLSLFNIRDLFANNFSPLLQKRNGRNREDIADARAYLKEFEEGLKTVLEELFDPKVPFSQTDDEKRCTYCTYLGMCNR